MLDAFLDALFDSLKVFALALCFYVIFSFFEGKIAKFLEKRRKFGPLFGAFAGSVPQCGISIVSSDLFLEGHISMGMLIAIYLSTSDEALPILFSDFSNRWYVGFVTLLVKMVYAFLVGFLVDLIYRKREKEVIHHISLCKEEENHEHQGCCGHEVEGEASLHAHVLHPLLHSLKIFLYCFVFTFLFNSVIFAVGGEERVASFLSNQYYLSPIYAFLVGLIPSCASSVVLSECYLSSVLPFGALLTGLSVNAGLGPLYLWKKKERRKDALLISLIMAVSSLLLGYLFLFIPVL